MELKRKFETGEIQVLCNSDILIEGFDEPAASVCLNLRPTLSAVVAEQRGGRVLRLDPQNSDKHATIVDFIDKTNNRKNIQITFVEASGGSFVSNKKPAANFKMPDKNFSFKVITDPKEVLTISEKMVERRKDVSPMGWFNISQTAWLEKVKPTVVIYVANQYRAAHPEWFQNFRDGTGRYREFFHSELVEIIRETVKAKEQAPVGWKTAQDLSEEVRRMAKTITKAANMLGAGHPEWYKKYFNPAGVADDYYSTDLVDKIKEYFISSRPWRGRNEQ